MMTKTWRRTGRDEDNGQGAEKAIEGEIHNITNYRATKRAK